MSYRDNIEKWLEYQKAIGQWPDAARKAAEEHPGVTCHKDIYGGHYWIQRYNDDGTVWLLHGADSTLPGLEARKVRADTISLCDCGKWMAASKEARAETYKTVREMLEALKN